MDNGEDTDGDNDDREGDDEPRTYTSPCRSASILSPTMDVEESPGLVVALTQSWKS